MKTGFLKLLFCCFILAQTTICLAADKQFAGLYVGGNVGLNTLTSHVKIDHSNIMPGAGEHSKLAANGLAGELRLGWNVNYDTWYFTLEAFGGSSTAKDKNQHKFIDGALVVAEPAVDEIGIKELHNYGFGIKVGKELNDSVISYFKLALRRTNFEFSDKTHNLAGTGLDYSQTKKETLTGIEPGFGVAQKLSDNITLNGDFSYTFYDAPKSKPAIAGQFGYRSYKPVNIGRFMIGVSYHFGTFS